MRIIWVGDAVVSTGFSLCTHNVCDVLHEMGHEVIVIGINHFGSPHDYPYKIYPAVDPFDGGRDAFGVGRLALLTQRLNPDVICILQDPWNIDGYLKELAALKKDCPEVTIPPVVAWCAVDSLNQRGDQLNGLSRLIVWTDFAAKELKKGGYKSDIDVVNLGVDLERFSPRDKEESRKIAGISNISVDSFVVGVVGRNQPRKRLDLTLSYFSAWIKSCGVDNAYLYLHVAPTGEQGCNIHSLVRYYGLGGKVVLSQPHIGHGIVGDEMAYIYSAFDVYMSTSQGEGWGLPCMEAMACGVPCIVPDWSALGDWPREAVVKVPCTSTALTAPLNSYPYTIGGVPDETEFVRALHNLYTSAAHRDVYRRRGPSLVAQERFRWPNIGGRFESILRSVVSNVPVEATPEPATSHGLRLVSAGGAE